MCCFIPVGPNKLLWNQTSLNSYELCQKQKQTHYLKILENNQKQENSQNLCIKKKLLRIFLQTSISFVSAYIRNAPFGEMLD